MPADADNTNYGEILFKQDGWYPGEKDKLPPLYKAIYSKDKKSVSRLAVPDKINSPETVRLHREETLSYKKGGAHADATRIVNVKITPLQFAYIIKSDETAALLLSLGADKNIDFRGGSGIADKNILNNTRWATYGSPEQKSENFTEVDFKEDGTVRFYAETNGRDNFSSGEGAYKYLPDTKEIFILMDNMTFSFVRSYVKFGPGLSTPVYEDIVFKGFQMYYKIKEYKDNKAGVEYCGMNGDARRPDKIWLEEAGKYKLLGGCGMKEEQFFITGLEDW